MYSLEVGVLQAKNLIPKDANGLSDPYVRLAVNSSQIQVEKTKTVKKCLHPTWNEHFSLFDTFFPDFQSCQLLLTVWDQDLLTDEFMGCVYIPLHQLCSPKYQIPSTTTNPHVSIFKLKQWFSLQPLFTLERFKHLKSSGQILLELEFTIDESKRFLCVHFDFEQNFHRTNSFRNKISSSKSQDWMHTLMPEMELSFRNLGSGNVQPTVGVNQLSSQAVQFTGFNYLFSSTNPFNYLTEFSVSFWFYTGHQVGKEMYFFSTLKSNLTKNSNSNTFTKRSSRLFASKMESSEEEEVISGETSAAVQSHAKRGIAIGTTKLILLDVHGNSIFVTDTKPMVQNKKSKFDDKEAFLDVHSLQLEDEQLVNSKALSAREAELAETAEELSEANRQLDYKVNEWNHLILCYSGSKLQVFLNSVLQSEYRCTMQSIGKTDQFFLGALEDEYCFTGFEGSLDEFKLFNYVINEDQIKQLFAFKK